MSGDCAQKRDPQPAGGLRFPLTVGRVHIENAQLQAMTVVQLRKLAEKWRKLSAGIKSGIVARLSEALTRRAGCSAVSAGTGPKRCMSRIRARTCPGSAERGRKPCPDAGEAARSASFGGCNRGVPRKFGLSSLEQPVGAGRLPSGYRQAWQARSKSRDTAQTPAWQQRAAGTVNRFGPPARGSPARQATPGAAPADREYTGVPEENVPKLDGYRLGYRGAPQRTSYQNRGEYAARDQGYNGYQQRGGYQQSGYRSSGSSYGYQQQRGYQPPSSEVSTITTHCTACRATRNLQPRLRKARFPTC